MYKIFVPVQNKYLKRGGREKYVEAFRKMGVERVFLALGKYEMDEKNAKICFQS